MNIAKKIKDIFEAATGLQLVYGTEEAINRAIGSSQLPCGLLKLMGTSNITTDGGLLTEEPRLSVAVVNLTQFDLDSYDNEDIIADCKVKLENFLLALMASRDLSLEAVTEVSRLYDHYDDIVTGIYATFRLREVVGVACPDGSAPVREIKITDNGTYNVEPYAVAIVDVQGGTPAVIEPLTVTPTDEPQTITPTPGVDGFAPVVVGACPVCPSPHIQPLSVTPSTSNQTFTPTAPVDGYGPVDVAAVDSTIDHNIQPQNIKAGVDILGVSGAYHGTIAPLNVSPSISAQTITPPAGTDGYAPVTVDAVTSAIDANIQPGNIKQGVEILGVVGTMQEGTQVKGVVWTNPVINPLAFLQGAICTTNYADMVTEIDDTEMTQVGAISVFVNIEVCKVLNATTLVSSFNDKSGSYLREFYGPNVTTINGYRTFRYNSLLETVTYGTLSSVANWTGMFTLCLKLRNVVVGAGTAISLNFQSWSPTNVIAEGQSGIDELNANIVAGLADRVADRTNDTALTITFGTSLYNVLTAETLAAFTSKNWNVAYA